MAHATSPDPLVPIDEDESLPEMDFPAHVRTFNAVLAAAKWFIVHLAILLVALYFIAIGGQPLLGAFFILCSIGLLIYGLTRRTSVRDDLAKGLGAGPGASDAAVRDPDPGEGDRT